MEVGGVRFLVLVVTGPTGPDPRFYHFHGPGESFFLIISQLFRERESERGSSWSFHERVIPSLDFVDEMGEHSACDTQ